MLPSQTAGTSGLGQDATNRLPEASGDARSKPGFEDPFDDLQNRVLNTHTGRASRASLRTRIEAPLPAGFEGVSAHVHFVGQRRASGLAGGRELLHPYARGTTAFDCGGMSGGKASGIKDPLCEVELGPDHGWSRAEAGSGPVAGGGCRRTTTRGAADRASRRLFARARCRAGRRAGGVAGGGVSRGRRRLLAVPP